MHRNLPGSVPNLGHVSLEGKNTMTEKQWYFEHNVTADAVCTRAMQEFLNTGTRALRLVQIESSCRHH